MYIGQPHYLSEINCSTSGLIFSRGDCLFSRYSNQDLMAADVLVGKLKVFLFFILQQFVLYFKNVDFNVLLNKNKKTIMKNVKADKNTKNALC